MEKDVSLHQLLHYISYERDIQYIGLFEEQSFDSTKIFSSWLFECSNHFAHRLCGGGEIQHSEIRLFLCGVNCQSVTLKRRELAPENLNFFVDSKLSCYFQYWCTISIHSCLAHIRKNSTPVVLVFYDTLCTIGESVGHINWLSSHILLQLLPTLMNINPFLCWLIITTLN